MFNFAKIGPIKYPLTVSENNFSSEDHVATVKYKVPQIIIRPNENADLVAASVLYATMQAIFTHANYHDDADDDDKISLIADTLLQTLTDSPELLEYLMETRDGKPKGKKAKGFDSL